MDGLPRCALCHDEPPPRSRPSKAALNQGAFDVRIHGEFNRNDVVEIVDATGRIIGIGLARYGSETARGVMGKHNEAALVHYDYLYIQQ